jgi:Tol biopolymer transport system component
MPEGLSRDVTLADGINYDTALVLSVSRISEDGMDKDWAVASPDGKKLLYCETEKKLTRREISDEGIASYRVMLLRDATRSQKTPIIAEFSFAPAWFDDSTTFAYIAFERDGDKLVRSGITGAGKTYITRNPIGRIDSRPNVKGRSILYDSEINGRRQIVSVQDNGANVTVLAEGHSASWHPGGGKFVYIRNDNILEMDMGNNLVTQLFGDRGLRCRTPRYSPDGKRILFQKETNVTLETGTGVVRWHLYLTNADGTGLSQLTMGNVDVFSPSWANDSEIYFISNAGGTREIWTASLAE